MNDICMKCGYPLDDNGHCARCDGSLQDGLLPYQEMVAVIRYNIKDHDRINELVKDGIGIPAGAMYSRADLRDLLGGIGMMLGEKD